MANYQVLITGANRGIGLEFTKQYAQDGWNVIACCRDPQSAAALQALANAHANIRIFSLDLADFAKIDALALQLKNESIDVLINNAGVYPDSSLGDADENEWLDAFKINSIAPLKMASAFTSHMAKGQLKKIATLSSKMGSVDDNTSGGSYIYRSTKTAVNMVMKSLSIDLKPYGIAVVTLHPGWVQTDMGGSNALINTQTSVSGLRTVIEKLNLSNTGKFIAYDGKEIAW
ncbi:SDR family oxidoreductase [Methylotenera sp.]|uniref:SDR family oxidoreductase n=1 Tax=Methylotenera sp. TaxID=2051956 RepID=UPI00271E0B8C|nr:SDR family oxidoreductase [Methylotenera sp.]MDO9206171.1 SDR family oxidoreductase [Methylotenera sp.]MDP1523717.1 SDR family oxidoreductase [Methylotenera sp.]MDP2070903.1 SDR family oxidoreductase [Methylotenera sp.]MDP2230257.1 SDR family oxidoreductase [Methylotenera sp.]MDP3005777.1 SDR family oxidoreductase [Methylotenera sp.]